MRDSTFVLLFAIITFGCSTSSVQSENSKDQIAVANGSSVRANSNENASKAEPWPIDFRNLTYPKDCLSEPGEKPTAFTLQNGEFDGGSEQVAFGFTSVRFADVTDDGLDEAIVVLSIYTGGSAVPHCIYVFQRKDEKVNLIHDFYGGDRASDGLRRLYGENGNLVVEQYVDDDGAGAARPNFYMRRRLEYTDGTFVITSEERFPNPDEAALFYPD